MMMLKSFETPKECMEFYNFFEKNHKEALEYYETCKYFSLLGIFTSMMNIWTIPFICFFTPMFVQSASSLDNIKREIRDYETNRSRCQEWIDRIQEYRDQAALHLREIRCFKKKMKYSNMHSLLDIEKVLLEHHIRMFEMNKEWSTKTRYPFLVSMTPWEKKRFEYLKREDRI